MINNDENDVVDISRRWSYISSMIEDETIASGIVGIISTNTLKSSTPNAERTVPNQTIPLFSIRKVYKNLILLSVVFVLLFTAYNGIGTLQSSLNVKNNVGVNSLLIIQALVMVSSSRRVTRKSPGVY